MGQAGGGLLIRTAAVTIVVMGFFGVATGALPVRCLIGGACGPTTPEAKTTAAPQPAAATPAPAGIEQVVLKTAPTLSSNDVIAGTFAQLNVELKPPGTPPTSPTQVASAKGPAAVVTNPDTGLSKRVVRALGVRPDGTPVMGTDLAEAYAAPAPLRPSPAVEAAAWIGTGQTPQVADVTPADLSPAVAPAEAVAHKATGVATVDGQGANVRSGPGKSGKVLFALRGGEQVTIVESKRGWMRIKDDQGRVGWIYSDGLTRS
jgi:hypothetical protein